MNGSRPRPDCAIRAVFALLAVLLLTCCSDTLHGSANANGGDRGSAGLIRLNLPL
ncbi:MAG: hypothetical protein ACREEL_04605 [Stellaceae bacterium]